MSAARSTPYTSTDAQAKLLALRAGLRSMRRLLVAYSGGVDSAFLAWVAHQELAADMLAVLADSPSLARAQMQDAVAFAEEQRIPLLVIATAEMERPEYRRNDHARCFHCKDELFTTMQEYARQQRLSHRRLWHEC